MCDSVKKYQLKSVAADNNCRFFMHEGITECAVCVWTELKKYEGCMSEGGYASVEYWQFEDCRWLCYPGLVGARWMEVSMCPRCVDEVLRTGGGHEKGWQSNIYQYKNHKNYHESQ